MSDELKPCPFCGEIMQYRSEDVMLHPSHGQCLLAGLSFDIQRWNDAWAHRRIAELEEQMSMEIGARDLRIAELEAFVRRLLDDEDITWSEVKFNARKVLNDEA